MEGDIWPAASFGSSLLGLVAHLYPVRHALLRKHLLAARLPPLHCLLHASPSHLFPSPLETNRHGLTLGTSSNNIKKHYPLLLFVKNFFQLRSEGRLHMETMCPMSRHTTCTACFHCMHAQKLRHCSGMAHLIHHHLSISISIIPA